MPLIKGTIAPLNVVGQRRLSYVPSHFVKMSVQGGDIHKIDRWIYTNLNNRYCVRSVTGLIDKKITDVCEIGFEEPSEMTMFSLACPYIR